MVPFCTDFEKDSFRSYFSATKFTIDANAAKMSILDAVLLFYNFCLSMICSLHILSKYMSTALEIITLGFIVL